MVHTASTQILFKLSQILLMSKLDIQQALIEPLVLDALDIIQNNRVNFLKVPINNFQNKNLMITDRLAIALLDALACICFVEGIVCVTLLCSQYGNIGYCYICSIVSCSKPGQTGRPVKHSVFSAWHQYLILYKKFRASLEIWLLNSPSEFNQIFH